uniref:SH2 domain-containing protein n=1 Tax=Panagrellus redivivus TaxID=6233 RepID=A0A7E4VLX0_PANRE
MKWLAKLKLKDGVMPVNADKHKRHTRQKSATANSFCPFSSTVNESSDDEESFLDTPIEIKSTPSARRLASFDAGYKAAIGRLPASNDQSNRNPLDLPAGPSSQKPVETLASTTATTAVAPVHSTVECTHVLVPDLDSIVAAPYYWGQMDRYEAEAVLDGKPEGTFLLRDSAQINYLFSVSFRRYSRTLHARIEHLNGVYSFDVHDASYYQAKTIQELVKRYKDPKQCLFYEPQLVTPLPRNEVFDLKHLCRSVIASNTSYEDVSFLPLPTSLKKYVREYHYKHPLRVTNFDV